MQDLLKRIDWARGFYFLSAAVMLQRFGQVLAQAQSLPDARWLFPASLMHISQSNQYVALAALCPLVLFGLGIYGGRWSALVASVAWCVWLALLNSFYKVANDQHGFFLVAFGAAIAELFNQRKCNLDYALAVMTSMYAAAGLWKFRGLLGGEGVLYEASQNLPYHIAYGLAENHRPEGMVFLDFFYHHAGLAALFWLFIAGGQIAMSLGLIFLPQWRSLFLIFFVAFHLGAKWIVGPAFQNQVVLLLFLIAVTALASWNIRRSRVLL